MKKQLLLSVITGLLLQGCNNYIKVTRTVSKTLVVPFQIDQAGNFQSNSSITGKTVIDLFDPDFFRTDRAHEIERFDVKSVQISGALNPQRNTATSVTITAGVVLGLSAAPLINEGKMVRLADNSLAFEASTGSSTFLNKAGVEQIQKTINHYFTNLATEPLSIVLLGKLPANQRLVGTITITVDASITYSRCEQWIQLGPFSPDEC